GAWMKRAPDLRPRDASGDACVAPTAYPRGPHAAVVSDAGRRMRRPYGVIRRDLSRRWFRTPGDAGVASPALSAGTCRGGGFERPATQASPLRRIRTDLSRRWFRTAGDACVAPTA